MTLTFEQMQSILSQVVEQQQATAQALTRLELETDGLREAIAETSRRQEIQADNARSEMSQIREAIAETRAICDSNARAIEASANRSQEQNDLLTSAMIRAQDRLERLERRDRRYQAEIRGLRIETRRILERWLGEPFPDEADFDDDPEEPTP